MVLGAKFAAHAHDRMRERTPLSPRLVNVLQRNADQLNLQGQTFHIPLRVDGGRLVGYAQFRPVPDRPKPVLVTVLGPQMRPRGADIEHMLKSGQMLTPPSPPKRPLLESRPGSSETPLHAMSRAFFTPSGDL